MKKGFLLSFAGVFFLSAEYVDDRWLNPAPPPAKPAAPGGPRRYWGAR